MKEGRITKKFPLTIAVVVLVLVVGQYFLWADVKKKSQQASALTNEYSVLANREQYMISTGKIIQNIEGDLERIHNSIVSKTGDVEFISGLERMAERNGLTISIDSLYLDVNPKATTSPIVPLKIKLKTKGQWAGTYRFLKEIENMPVKVKVSSYSIIGEQSNVSSEDVLPISTGRWESNVDISVLKYR